MKKRGIICQPGKRVSSIMHDAVKVVHLSQWVHLIWLHLQEVILLPFWYTDIRGETSGASMSKGGHWQKPACRSCTCLDVVSDDAYMLVTVWPSVLVPEADHMAEFMDHDAKLIAVLPDGDGLRTSTSPPYIGATPAGRNIPHITSLSDPDKNLLLNWRQP